MGNKASRLAPCREEAIITPFGAIYSKRILPYGNGNFVANTLKLGILILIEDSI